MKRKQLEMILQGIRKWDAPSPKLEQYETPATAASDVLFNAFLKGDVLDCSIIDLGAGTGILSLGAALLGAGSVTSVDIDNASLEIFRSNIQDLLPDYEFSLINSDVKGLSMDIIYDTCFMNPPFGSQNRRADRPFLEKALSISRIIYTFHMAVTREFIHRFVGKRGAHVEWEKEYSFHLPHRFFFHEKDRKEIRVIGFRILTGL